MSQADMRPTPSMQAGQLRAARALLNWTVIDASRKAGVSVATLVSIERETRPVASDKYDQMFTAYMSAGMHFDSTDAHGIGIYCRGLGEAS